MTIIIRAKSEESVQRRIPPPLEGDAYWEMVQKTAAEVDKWPPWKRGERTPDPEPEGQSAKEMMP